jgi:hypothetical protein
MRTTLTYIPTSFRRARIFGLVAIACIIVFLILFHSAEMASLKNGGAPHSIAIVIAAFGAISSALTAIEETIFVLWYRNPHKIFEFDNHNLYMSEDDTDKLAIPFKSIIEIHMALRNNYHPIRAYIPYLIRYTTDGLDDEVSIRIYWQTREKFNQFKERVKCDNPSLQLVNWTITGEDWSWRRQRRK